MLKKLLKYDLENIFKVLLIFYGLSLFFACFTRIFLSIENSFAMNLIGQILSGVTISMIANILINNLMRCWVRFRQNLYGDESYLTHTLPVTKKTLYLSKILMAVITLFTSVLVIALTIFIAYYSKEFIESIKNMLLPLANLYDSKIVTLLLVFLLICFLEIANLLQAGYTGIILGHQKNNMKIGYSVIYGLLTYIITQIFVIFIIFIMGLFNKDLMNLFITNELINMDMIKLFIYMAIILYSLIIIICGFINIKLFNKGVNVD